MTKRKVFIRMVALCMAVCMLLTLTACKGKEGGETTTAGNDGTTGADKIAYTVEVKSEGGMALEGIGVYVYTDSTKAELVTFAKTDASGQISFTDISCDSFIAVLDNVPAGYQVQESYVLNAGDTQIVLTSGLASGDDLENVTYKLGDVIHDFTVTTPDGSTYTMSELLKQKKAVVLNFWFTNCNPCRNEFPFLQSAYEQYSQDIEVLALNPVDGDDAKIAAFQSELELTFPMAQCEQIWEQMLQIVGYPTTVVIDRYGVISLIHSGTITEKGVFEDVFAHFAADDYQQGVVENMDDIVELEPAPGSNADSPIEIGGVSSFEVTVEPGQLVYYNIYKVTNMYLQIVNSSAYAVYNGYTYNPQNGVIGFNVTTPDTYTPASVVFGNSGKEKVTYTVTLSAYQGTNDNPYTLSLGDFKTNVNPGNDQGVCYNYRVTEDGTFTLQCLGVTGGVDYDFAVYNTSTGAFRTLATEGSDDRSVSVKAYAGNLIRVIISTLPDSSNTYPGATFRMNASFTAGELEEEEKVELLNFAITVTDENRNPVLGVYLYVETETEVKAVATNEKGIALIKLPAGTYPVSMAVPEGYTAKTTQFRLTEARPTIAVKLDTIVIEEETYTVKAVNETGAPVENVLVSIGTSYGYTNQDGVFSVLLLKDNYQAVIAAPEGYTAESNTFVFADGANELTVTLTKRAEEENPDVNRIDYTVTITDYNGKAMSDVTVQLLKDGQIVAMQVVDANGIASLKLEPGDYQIGLAFSGSTLYYDHASAVVTAEAPAVTIQVAQGVSGTPEELYVGNAYHVTTGGTYVKLQSGVTNYYLFEPTEAGVYKFTTSDPNAVISYWGASTAFIADQTSGTDYADNAFTRNVKDRNIGVVYIIGITGAEECILEITRIGDPILDETDIVPEVYEGKTTPNAVYQVTGASGKVLKYVDLTAATDAVKLVYNEADGFYHLNTVNGPVLYMNLSLNAPYLSVYQMLGLTGFGGTSLTQVFRDEDGKAVRREDYTACLQVYAQSIDPTYGVYPLTEDLIYMIQQGGDYKGWWDIENGNYLFTELPNLNAEIAWMFAVCYFE